MTKAKTKAPKATNSATAAARDGVRLLSVRLYNDLVAVHAEIDRLRATALIISDAAKYLASAPPRGARRTKISP